EQLPAAEDSPIQPEAPYGQAKFAAEGYCELYRRLHGLSTISLRLGNVYGPRQDPVGGAGVMAILCGTLLEGVRPTVFGDGKQTRDYIYVGDVVDAALIVAGNDLSGSFQVGRGLATTGPQLNDILPDPRETEGE